MIVSVGGAPLKDPIVQESTVERVWRQFFESLSVVGGGVWGKQNYNPTVAGFVPSLLKNAFYIGRGWTLYLYIEAEGPISATNLTLTLPQKVVRNASGDTEKGYYKNHKSVVQVSGDTVRDSVIISENASQILIPSFTDNNLLVTGELVLKSEGAF